jgi:uncharacterized protein YbaR (Trm112 family)
MKAIPADLLACPRCDRTPLDERDGAFECSACKVVFPSIGGVPWLFAEPQASLAEWRGRLHSAMEAIRHEIAGLDRELRDDGLRDSTRGRVSRYRERLDRYGSALASLLAPLDIEAPSAGHETYLALRTRMPADQGINTYHANLHRDWCWGEAENEASFATLRAVLGDATELGDVLVPGAGGGRLAYDVFRGFRCRTLTAFDFNPLLMLVAQRMYAGEALELVEFPLAPLGADDGAVLRTLRAPDAAGNGLHVVMGDALRAPFAAGRFDTVITPWLIDIIDEDLPTFAARINRLLRPGGRWVNFGSLAYDGARRARRYASGEVAEAIAEAGFEECTLRDDRIPYLQSPASRHARFETVFTFAATKERTVAPPARHRALPDWIVTGKEPVPLDPAFRTQALASRIHAFVMSLIDGKRTIHDMAALFERERLMGRDEAVPAIRQFLIRMYDDARRAG